VWFAGEDACSGGAAFVCLGERREHMLVVEEKRKKDFCLKLIFVY